MTSVKTASVGLDLSMEFRRAMRQLVGGVCAISVGNGEGRGGLVATSVTSLSVEPPTILVCVSRAASAWPAIREFGCFAVNVLAHQHQEFARTFSGQTGARGAARYEGGDWLTAETGAPVLADALVAVDCEVEEILERHSHGIVIGRVRAVTPIRERAALVYVRGTYAPLLLD
jgi:flavin reductase (DIM6/NTAB) family NADH-FMN oxidoreductase RutF